jgi:ketosteroid isomerase-like protein
MSTPSKPQTAHLLASPDDVEAQFYEALREADLDKLMALWADDDEVFCVHPGGPRVVGPRAIRVAFEAVFASNGRIHVQPERHRRLQTMDTAVHNLVERVQVRTSEGTRTGFVLATNVFIKTTQGWRLVAHHASPGTAEESTEIIEAPSVLH